MGDRKNDMERVGLFQEMGYVSIGDKYKAPGISFNEKSAKGKQMLPGGTKDKSALQHGYFNDKFTRVLEGEAYSDPIKMRRQNRLEEAKRNLSKPFLPSSGDRKPSGLGSHFGTFGGNVSAFSPGVSAGKGYKAPGKNVLTNPGKKGTGFGYAGVTLSAYPPYKSEHYDRARELIKKEVELHRKSVKGGSFKLNLHPQAYFDNNPYKTDKNLPPLQKTPSGKSDLKPFKPSSPGKKPAGAKIGTFDPYPTHSTDPYNVKYVRPVHVVNKSGKIFSPSQGPKTTPCNSIVNQNVLRTMNVQNYRSMTVM
ncbi:hypothetical protein LOTGIDRAFT_210983 [Lottia gigantea]|uniref:Cilia-and flagella-associated protein 96 n=1 Tax=Lottia gigantea TaxID=225164 RepID=V3ZNH3_LOTGI|nr:hypothetical protein LOTGIDRAFT_210983 [Lottia gigantea]ESO84025.1 hypothetical protein LOTGIDRAFT_210983 [Lottia gigantea]